MISKYNTIHSLLTNVQLVCREEGSSNRYTGRNESVETRDESIEAGEKHNNYVIIIIQTGYL